MRKALPLTLLLVLCIAIPLFASGDAGDEKAAGEGMPMAPPPALDPSTFGWLVGEWQGWTESPMGKSEDWMSCRMDLGGQFLIMEYKSKTSMGEMTGMGALTMKDGKVKGYWIDSWRSMSEGTGTMEGGKTTMTWSGPMGDHTRVMELVGEDKIVTTIKMNMGGQEMEAHSEMERVKQMGKGNQD